MITNVKKTSIMTLYLNYKQCSSTGEYLLITYTHNLQILLQGRQDNPLHEAAFNELIENLNERNTHLLGERSVNRTLFMDENSDRSH